MKIELTPRQLSQIADWWETAVENLGDDPYGVIAPESNQSMPGELLSYEDELRALGKAFGWDYDKATLKEWTSFERKRIRELRKGKRQ